MTERIGSAGIAYLVVGLRISNFACQYDATVSDYVLRHTNGKFPTWAVLIYFPFTSKVSGV